MCCVAKRPYHQSTTGPSHCRFSPVLYPTTSHKEVISILGEIWSPLCLSFKGSVREDGQRNLTSTSGQPTAFYAAAFPFPLTGCPRSPNSMQLLLNGCWEADTPIKRDTEVNQAASALLEFTAPCRRKPDSVHGLFCTYSAEFGSVAGPVSVWVCPGHPETAIQAHAVQQVVISGNTERGVWEGSVGR